MNIGLGDVIVKMFSLKKSVNVHHVARPSSTRASIFSTCAGSKACGRAIVLVNDEILILLKFCTGGHSKPVRWLEAWHSIW